MSNPVVEALVARLQSLWDGSLSGKASLEHNHHVSIFGDRAYNLEDIGDSAVRARIRTERNVRGGWGPPPEWLEEEAQSDGDIWIDLSTMKFYRYEEEWT